MKTDDSSCQSSSSSLNPKEMGFKIVNKIEKNEKNVPILVCKQDLKITPLMHGFKVYIITMFTKGVF
jgi:hypothetical protein